MGFLKVVVSIAFILFQAIQARNDCRPLFCGNNPFVVRFPFRLRGQQSENCGYRGFDLICSRSQRPEVILNLPYSGDFWVRDINYVLQEIQLYDPNGCLPRRLLSLNLTSSPFTASYSQNVTFLSCPTERVRDRFTVIDCLSNSTVSVLATHSLNLVRLMNMCSTIVTLPLPGSWSLDDEWLAWDINQDLTLTWNVPKCEDCEAKGGICGFENRTSDRILCFTNPDTDKPRGLQIFRIIALSIVIPAITCSICISYLICVVERRRGSGRDVAGGATVAPPPPPPVIVGLDESTIESYKKVVLGESKRLPGPNGATCPICLVDYHPKDALRCIPECEHCFHCDCVDEWLRMNSTCPVCRNSPSPARADT